MVGTTTDFRGLCIVVYIVVLSGMLPPFGTFTTVTTHIRMMRALHLRHVGRRPSPDIALRLPHRPLTKRRQAIPMRGISICVFVGLRPRAHLFFNV